MPDKSGFYEIAASQGEYLLVTPPRMNYCRPHFHNSVEIVIPLGDGFRVTVNGEKYVLNAFDAAFINRFDIHYWPVQELDSYVLVIGENYCSRIYQSEKDKVFPTVLRANKEAVAEFMPIVELMSKQPRSVNEIMKYGFADMFFGILKKYYPLVPRKNSLDTNLITEILYYIEKNLTQEITLTGLAEKFGYSKTYLSALFNGYTGMHFRDYVNRSRAELALGMLVDKEKNNETVLSIAGKCGFDSPNTFYRAMKKYDPKNHNF